MSKANPLPPTSELFRCWRELEPEARVLAAALVEHVSSCDHALCYLLTSWLELGTDERRVLLTVAQRLVAGRATYGELKLESDRRDMRQEAFEEAIDGFAYACAALLRGSR